jgi:hypothetical protein
MAPSRLARHAPRRAVGRAYTHGVPFYFPVLFLLKTPLAALGSGRWCQPR